MRRREFIGLLGGAAVTWPRALRGQQLAMPVVGFLSSGASGKNAHMVNAFKQGLNETGYVDGQNVSIEYRWAEGHYDQLPAMASELAARRVAAIVAVGGTVVALAAKAATSTIPVVFLIGDDPAKAGLVASFNHPAGNITGLSQLAAALGAKRVELLHELKPEAATLGVLINPSNPNAESDTKEAQAAAHVVGKKIVVVHAASEHEFESVFAQLVRSGVGALMVSNDAFFTNQREQLVALAARNVMPAIYAFREYTVAGGLISYGPSFLDMYRQVGIYAGRVLKGEQPRDLPVMQPTRFELVINLKTARALGLDAPAKVLALADEVIE